MKLHVDNSTVVACINNFESTQSVIINELVISIRLQYLSFRCPFFKGSLNALADLESRKIRDDTEWILNSELFLKIISVYTRPVVDLFASPIHNQIIYQGSINDLLVRGTHFHVYIYFSPFSLIPRILKKGFGGKSTRCDNSGAELANNEMIFTIDETVRTQTWGNIGTATIDHKKFTNCVQNFVFGHVTFPENVPGQRYSGESYFYSYEL